MASSTGPLLNLPRLGFLRLRKGLDLRKLSLGLGRVAEGNRADGGRRRLDTMTLAANISSVATRWARVVRSWNSKGAGAPDLNGFFSPARIQATLEKMKSAAGAGRATPGSTSI